MVSKDKLKQLFSPSLTGKNIYSADEILISIETMPDEAFSRIPTVEAIPIEWLKSWAMKNWVKSKKCEFDIIVSKLIDDWWEKENE